MVGLAIKYEQYLLKTEGMTQKLIAFPLPSDPQVAAGMMEPFYKVSKSMCLPIMFTNAKRSTGLPICFRSLESAVFA